MAAILVIEDQVFHQEMVRDILQGEGYELVPAVNCTEAYRMANARTFDLVLVDIYLPDENGLDFCRRLAARQPNTPIIIMTSSPSLELVIESMRQGAYDFLVKPLNADVVRLSVRRALERRALVEEKKQLVQQLMDANNVLRSFQRVTMATVSGQRPGTILLKALKGLIEVTGAGGGAVLLKGEDLNLAFPLRHERGEGSGGPGDGDLALVFEAFRAGLRIFTMPRGNGDGTGPDLSFDGPMMAASLDLTPEAEGGVALWKNPGAAPFRAADLSITSKTVRTLGYLLRSRLRHKNLQKANRRLKRQVAMSTVRMKETSARLERLVGEVEKEKTRTTEALKRLEAIHRIGHELGSFVDIEKHIHEVMNLCMETLQAKSISLLLYDPERCRLHIKHAIGLPPEVLAGVRIKPGEGIAGWVFREGEPLFVPDVEKDERFRKTSISQYETNSLISAPVKSKGKPIGVLNINNKVDGTPFTRQDLDMLVFISQEVGVAIENTQLYEDIQNSYFQTIRTLVKVLEAKDETTKGHSERVTRYCLDVGRAMDLTPHSLEILNRAAILHDLGKIMVDLSILHKEGKLTEDEYRTIREHPLVAAEIIKPMKYMEEVQRCISQHHERQDGRGYPYGIRDIALEARILSVADAYDAMTSWRPYRAALPHEKAAEELLRCAGSQFDPKVVDVFLAVVHPEGAAASAGPQS